MQWSDAQRGWVLLSHAEVEAGFRDVARLSADRSEIFARVAARRSPAFAEVAALLSGWMNFRDDPAHARLREPVRAAFTPRRAGAFEADVRAIVERRDRRVPARGRGRALRGVRAADPRARDRVAARRRARGQHALHALVGRPRRDRVLARTGALDEAPLVSATREFASFFGALVERERARPSGNLLSALVHSEVGSLDPLELVGACTLALVRRARDHHELDRQRARAPARAPRARAHAARPPRALGHARSRS